MFAAACATLRPTVYSVCVASTSSTREGSISLGTGFVIAPGVLVTASHLLERHAANETVEVHVCSRQTLDSQPYAWAEIAAKDASRELLLLNAETGAAVVRLALAGVPMGTACGILGYPHGHVQWPDSDLSQNIIQANTTMRFHAAHIAAAYPMRLTLDQPLFAG